MSVDNKIGCKNNNVDIDWNDLDEFWEKQYTEDYGHLFTSIPVITEYS